MLPYHVTDGCSKWVGYFLITVTFNSDGVGAIHYVRGQVTADWSFQGLWIFSQKLLYLKEFLLLFISMDIKAFTEWICNLSVGGWEKDCGMEAELSFWPWQECSITHLTVKWYKTFHSAVWLRKCDFFPQVGAVVVGLDQYINYYKLQ